MASTPEEGSSRPVREEEKAGGHRTPLLCQPDDRKSCAWCCGLYNVRDSGQEELIARLRRRTRNFFRTERAPEPIIAYGEETKAEERLQLLDPDFYSCEFVGFLDATENRVGCLLNPLSRGNGGIDWRGLSFHGGSACGGFLCRAFRRLTDREREIVLLAVEGWYGYGLIISDVDYIKAVLRLVERILGPALTPAQGRFSPAAITAIRAFFRWQIDRRFTHGGGLPKQPNDLESPAQIRGGSLPRSWPDFEEVLARLGLSGPYRGEGDRVLVMLERLMTRQF